MPLLGLNAALRTAPTRAHGHRSPYATQLQKLAEAVWEKLPRQPSVQFHDNAISHVAVAIHQEIKELCRETASHLPLYSLDEAHSDHLRSVQVFWLKKSFTKFEDKSGGRRLFDFWSEKRRSLICPINGPL